jgi:hypothetical protein
MARLEGLGKLKKFTTFGTRTGDLPGCSIVPQPYSVSPDRDRVLYKYINFFSIHFNIINGTRNYSDYMVGREGEEGDSWK